MKYLIIIATTMLAMIGELSAQSVNHITEIYAVRGECEDCKQRIESTLHKMKIPQASWSYETEMLTVTYDTTLATKAAILKKIADVGHDNEMYKASAAVYKKLPACCHYNRNEEMPVAPTALEIGTTKAATPFMTATYAVRGECEDCQQRIESTLHKMKIPQASWSYETEMLTVTFDSTKVTKDAILKKIADVGHDNELYKASDAVYKKLPDCCHYDRKKAMPTVTAITLPATNTENIEGNVVAYDDKGVATAISGVNVTVLETGRTMETDKQGRFSLPSMALPVHLLVSYIGKRTDTLTIKEAGFVQIAMKPAGSIDLTGVVITARRPSSFVSTKNAYNTLQITSAELRKAACCNLSESFDTSPSVDVAYADAVTGIKQIQLLGLAGNYTQITTENTPEIRGLASVYGLTFIPGPWIEGIEVTKGTGSVVNGFESIAGQINIEEIKPDEGPKFFANTYANQNGRLETTVNTTVKINDKWSTALLTHANGMVAKADRNNDGFIDNPVGRQFNVINRWEYSDGEGLHSQFAIKALTDKRQSGQMSFNPATDKFTTRAYGVGIDVEQYAFMGKLGYVFPTNEYKSVGLILSGTRYDNDSYYGLTKYTGTQNSMYANLIYQNIIRSPVHKFRTGLSLINDDYKEQINADNFDRKEVVPGAFIEYTYAPSEKLTAIAGFRVDDHNAYGLMATPRLHVKYDLSKKTNLRFSAGSGFRTANVFAENMGLFASSRQYNLTGNRENYAYGFEPEKAWNFGANLIHSFKLNRRNGSISFDAYHTNFENKVVVDLDNSPQKILFYNLSGQSYSNNLQVEVNYELIKRLEVRLAYKWLDVKTNYSGALLQNPMIAKHRGFVNLAYATKSKWSFDLTSQWLSKKRLPSTVSNPAGKQMPTFSPAYTQMSGQISKTINKKWDAYVGVENLTNFRQTDLFIAGDAPFSQFFDGSMVWGPVNGRMVYIGMRFTIARD